MRTIPFLALLLAIPTSTLFNNPGNNNTPLLVSAAPAGRELWIDLIQHHVPKINIDNETKSKKSDETPINEFKKAKREFSSWRRSFQERAPPGNENKGNGNNSPNGNKGSNGNNNNNVNNSNNTVISGNSNPAPTSIAQSPGIVSGQAVPTGSLSTTAMALIGIVGVLFVSFIFVFVCIRRKKSREQTKEIIIKSATAFEQQSTYEKLDEPEAPRPLGRYTAVAVYTAAMYDELDIEPGDKVTILVEYDDGWVQGINETRGCVKGVFPGSCIDKNNNGPALMLGKRSSSMNYGYQTVNLH